MDKQWLSECNNCGRAVTPSLHSIKNRGSKGCIYCAGNAATDPAYAQALLRRAGAEPLEPFPGRNSRWKACCLDPGCRAVVYPILRSIQRNGSPACPECSDTGFNPLAPSSVYLVINLTLSAAKVGIMNAGSSRLDQHRRAGWHTHDTAYAAMGWVARAAERAVISRWRELGWQQAITDPAAMPQGGMSETVALVPGGDPHVLWQHVLTAVDHAGQTRASQRAGAR